MAREVNFNFSLNVRKVSENGLVILNEPLSHASVHDLVGAKGPLPGSLLISLTGTTISLAQLTTPGWCVFKHQGIADGTDPGDDPSIYYIDICIKDLISGRSLPFMELQPGMAVPFYFSRNLLEAYNSTGTGTGPANNVLEAQAYIKPCNLWIGAFER